MRNNGSKLEPTNSPRALSIQQKFQFEISEIPRAQWMVHSSCTDPTQATARLVLVLVSRIQESGSGNNDFVKWKGTCRSERPNRPKWPDLSKWITFKAGLEYFGRTKPKWYVLFDVPTVISGILGWMESAHSLTKQNWTIIFWNSIDAKTSLFNSVTYSL